jgi:hypothetical protein
MTWQIVTIGVLALLPFALLADFHPHRERLDSRGRPLPRDWVPQGTHSDADADDH